MSCRIDKQDLLVVFDGLANNGLFENNRAVRIVLATRYRSLSPHGVLSYYLLK